MWEATFWIFSQCAKDSKFRWKKIVKRDRKMFEAWRRIYEKYVW